MNLKTAHAVVIDREGDVVWAQLLIENEGGEEAIVFKVEPLLDGTGIVYNTQSAEVDGDAVLYRMLWNGESLPSIKLPGGHTDFVQLPDGGFGMLGWEIQEFEDGTRRLLGDTIMEVDSDGEIREIWNAFDNFVVDLNQAYSLGLLPDDPECEDWSHVNSLAYVSSEDAYYITMTRPQAVVRIERATGAQTWVLTGTGGDGDFSTTDVDLVDWPHSSQRVDAGLLIFNRRNRYLSETCSEAVYVSLDEDAWTAEATWSYAGERCAQIGFLGNALQLAGGTTLVSWSHLGLLEEVDAEGELVWQAELALGAGFGFVTVSERLQ
jgi:hypothetical protein